MASARAIERMMSHEPGLRWLAGAETINYHTLADFRVGHKEALEELFAQLLALLEGSGVVDLNALLHDGTKVRAVAGRASLHRRKTLEKRLGRRAKWCANWTGARRKKEKGRTSGGARPKRGRRAKRLSERRQRWRSCSNWKRPRRPTSGPNCGSAKAKPRCAK